MINQSYWISPQHIHTYITQKKKTNYLHKPKKTSTKETQLIAPLMPWSISSCQFLSNSCSFFSVYKCRHCFRLVSFICSLLKYKTTNWIQSIYCRRTEVVAEYQLIVLERAAVGGIEPLQEFVRMVRSVVMSKNKPLLFFVSCVFVVVCWMQVEFSFVRQHFGYIEVDLYPNRVRSDHFGDWRRISCYVEGVWILIYSFSGLPLFLLFGFGAPRHSTSSFALRAAKKWCFYHSIFH